MNGNDDGGDAFRKHVAQVEQWFASRVDHVAAAKKGVFVLYTPNQRRSGKTTFLQRLAERFPKQDVCVVSTCNRMAKKQFPNYLRWDPAVNPVPPRSIVLIDNADHQLATVLNAAQLDHPSVTLVVATTNDLVEDVAALNPCRVTEFMQCPFTMPSNRELFPHVDWDNPVAVREWVRTHPNRNR